MSKKDPLDQLTIAELDSGSRLLKTDLVTAIGESTMNRWQGLAIVAWLIARRTDPQAKVETYRQMTAVELSDVLGLNDTEADEQAPADPSGDDEQLTTDADVDTIDQPIDALAAEITADPTDPAPVPS